MRILIKAKAGEREERVEAPEPKLLNTKDELEVYTVRVKEPPERGKANDAIIKLLAGYFNLPRSHIRLVSGATSKRKIFEIER